MLFFIIMNTLFFKIYFIACILFFGVVAMAPFHPLKMSFSKAQVDASGQFQISSKLFLDDLTDLLEEKYRLKDLSFEGEHSSGVKALHAYYQENVRLSQNYKDVDIRITSVNIIEDGIVLLVKAASQQSVDNLKPLYFQNSLFFETFPNQMNMVKFNNKEFRFHLREKQIILNE